MASSFSGEWPTQSTSSPTTRSGSRVRNDCVGFPGNFLSVKFGSSSNAATVPILPPLAAELRAHRIRVGQESLARVQPDALAFTTSRGRGKPQSARNVLRAVYAAGDAAGLNGDGREPVGLHDLRHSFVAVCLSSRLTLPEASVLARHASPRITATTYAGLTDESREQLTAKLTQAFEA